MLALPEHLLSLLATAQFVVAVICLAWCIGIVIVQVVGITQLSRHFSSPPPKPIAPSLPHSKIPHITIIRPAKGDEAHLYDCIASTFRQNYPRDKLTIRLCVSDPHDAAYPILKRVSEDFPGYDCKVLLESEDTLLDGPEGHRQRLGPNPKIRNISRAYREARDDSLIWIVDCNVWIGKETAGRMVDNLLGLSPDGNTTTTPYKFVHQLPLVVDTPLQTTDSKFIPELQSSFGRPSKLKLQYSLSTAGGRLDEMFMASTHAKFYTAINTVGAAPCVLGKSNMFRKSHLDAATNPVHNPALDAEPNQPFGIDYFSFYICEDHLIADLLWKWEVPGFGRHKLVLDGPAIQPMSNIPVSSYIARRVRWLRARKWTVLVATFVEPGVECFLWSAYFTFAALTLPWFHSTFGLPQGMATNKLFAAALWLVCVSIWATVDWAVHKLLLSGLAVDVDHNTPAFAQKEAVNPRPFVDWLAAWLAREGLALPIWSWAFYGPTEFSWRGKSFRVATDMRVIEIPSSSSSSSLLLAGDDKTLLQERRPLMAPMAKASKL